MITSSLNLISRGKWFKTHDGVCAIVADNISMQDSCCKQNQIAVITDKGHWVNLPADTEVIHMSPHFFIPREEWDKVKPLVISLSKIIIKFQNFKRWLHYRRMRK